MAQNSPQSNNTDETSAETRQEVNYVPLTKYYVFNETGNILLSTTSQDENVLSDSFRDICAEAGVFFAAMTKSIHSVINPDTKQPYSIYNYRAMKSVIDNSGVFIGVNQQRMTFKSEEVGENFSKDLIQFLLGRQLGATRLNFAQSMFGAMGEEAKCLCKREGKHTHDDDGVGTDEVGNIFFICESLLGMPLVSAIVVHYKATVEIDDDHDSLLDIVKDALGAEKKERTWEFYKDTFMFVAPKLIKNYAADLNATSTPDFRSLVQSLSVSLMEMKSAT